MATNEVYFGEILQGKSWKDHNPSTQLPQCFFRIHVGLGVKPGDLWPYTPPGSSLTIPGHAKDGVLRKTALMKLSNTPAPGVIYTREVHVSGYPGGKLQLKEGPRFMATDTGDSFVGMLTFFLMSSIVDMEDHSA